MHTIAQSKPIGLAVVLAGSGAILLWSGTAIANKIAVVHMDPMTAGVLRSMLAGLIALSIVLATRLPRPGSRAQWGLLLVSGISSFALWPMLMSLGLGYTTANHTVLIMAVLPALTGLLGSALERRLPSRGWWLGVGIAMAGTVYLIFVRGGAPWRSHHAQPGRGSGNHSARDRTGAAEGGRLKNRMSVFQPRSAGALCFRNCFGVIPVCFLNVRVNASSDS
jgi:drug/metabolite transporter (DMT)-like permease